MDSKIVKKPIDEQIVDAQERRKMFLVLAEREHVRIENLLKKKFKVLSGRTRTGNNEVDTVQS